MGRGSKLVRIAVFMVAALLGALVLNACTTHRDHLIRGQRYYDENEFEKALAIWRALEPDADSLTDQERARYAYLRGMTDYRLGYRSHARHWLAIAKAIDKKYPGGLDGDWRGRADSALEDLNKDVYGIERFDGGDTANGEEATSDEPKDPSAEAAPAEDTGPKACRTDSECPGDQVCITRQCVSP